MSRSSTSAPDAPQTSALSAPTSAAWYRFARVYLLSLGAVLLAAGVAFFVAANWGDLTPNQRLALVGGALIASAATGAVLGLATFSGRLAVLLAGLLFGPLIALYGQIYQTGADAWEVYATWTLVFAGFAALARRQEGWVLWLLLLQLTAWLFTGQSVTQRGLFSAEGLPVVLVMALVYALIVAGLEWRARASGQRPLVVIYTATGLGMWTLVGCAAMAILEFGQTGVWQASDLARLFAVVAATAALGAIYWSYREWIPDLLLLAVAATGTCVLTSCLLAHWLSEADTDNTTMALLLGLAICAQVWALTTWLLHWRRRHRAAAPMASLARPAETGQAQAGQAQSGEAEAPGKEDEGDEARDTPWFVHLFVGVGTWVGAIALLAFLGLAGLFNDTTATTVLGGVLYVGALVLGHRGSTSILLTQLTWVLVVLGQLCMAIGIGIDDSNTATLWLAALQIPTLIFVRYTSLRLAAAFALPLCLTWTLGLHDFEPIVVQLLSLLLAASVVALWWWPQRLALASTEASEHGNPWRPLGLGLAAGLTVPLLAVMHVWSPNETSLNVPPLVSALFFAALTLAVLARALHGLGISLRQAAPFAAAAGLLAVSLLTMDVPGVSAGFLLLVLGFWRRERWLLGLGLTYVAVFLTSFYYRLDVPLLEKSLWILATGAVLLATGVALRRLRGHPGEGPLPAGSSEGSADTAAPAKAQASSRHQRLAALAALTVVALAIPGVQAYQKQRIVDHGRTVLLELRPIDPRSLMQGDYMELNYQIYQSLTQEVLETQPRRGHLVLRLDERGVGEFVDFWDGSELASDQQLLAYRLRLGRWRAVDVRTGIESYFFEEGRAGFFSNAKYAELRLSEDGEPVLIGLLGPEMQVLGGR